MPAGTIQKGKVYMIFWFILHSRGSYQNPGINSYADNRRKYLNRVNKDGMYVNNNISIILVKINKIIIINLMNNENSSF